MTRPAHIAERKTTMTKEQLQQLQPATLERKLAAANARRTAANDALIDAGRGHELASETRAAAKLGDPLAIAWCAAQDAHLDLLFERKRRIEYHGTTRRT